MIQVIDRVFNILEHLRDSQVLSLSCLAKHMGLNKSTLCNILKTMTDLGYIENDGSGNYRISEKFKQLAQPLPQEELLKSQCMHFCKMARGRNTGIRSDHRAPPPLAVDPCAVAISPEPHDQHGDL